MKKPLIIGMCYKKGVGKNTIAKFLSTHLRCTDPFTKVQELSFAHKLKDICYQLYSWAGIQRPIYYESHRDDKEIILEKLGKSPRQIWIEVGNYLRKVYPSTWIDYALNNIKSDIVIITDVGFINECEKIKDREGYLIKIIRDNLPIGNDDREVELDGYENFDLQIINNGSLDDLYEQALKIWEYIKNDR